MESLHHNALHFAPQDVGFCAHRRSIIVDLQAEIATEIILGTLPAYVPWPFLVSLALYVH
jgi:hypothetical protein